MGACIVNVHAYLHIRYNKATIIVLLVDYLKFSMFNIKIVPSIYISASVCYSTFTSKFQPFFGWQEE